MCMQVLTPTQEPFTGCRGPDHREKVLEKKLLQLSVRGEPLFKDLSYFKCGLLSGAATTDSMFSLGRSRYTCMYIMQALNTLHCHAF